VVRENGLALQFADSKLINDEDIVASAVGNNRMSLQLDFTKDQNNKEIMLIAVTQKIQ
jgi:hypothetical protein